MSDPTVIRDIGEKDLAALYSGVTRDLQGTATTHNAGDLFNKANAESTRLHNFAEDTIARIVSGKKPSADDPKPEAVTAALLSPRKLKQGGSHLEALNAELPDVRAQLAAAHLHDIANPTGANPPPVGKNLLNVWGKMSPEAQAALLPPSARARMNALAGVSRRLASLPAPKASSASHAATGLGLGTALAAAGAGVNHLMGGHPLGLETLAELAGGSSTIGALAGGAKNRVLSTLANSPAVARYAASLPPGWVLPPSLQAAGGAWTGEEGGNGLEGR